MVNAKEIKLNLGATVRELRKRRNITQEQLAEYIDLQPQTIATLETGRTFTSSEVLANLCNYFNVEPALFFLKQVRIPSEEDIDYINEIKRMLPTFSSSRLKDIYNILIALQK
ncbi:helix-turn-helix transcriptional regulator [bacterium]|nr:helix-turn-helix transcriptional regulator [bacterium]